MQRHYRDSHTRKRMASAHAKRSHHCSCGKFVFGNGGAYQHRQMHERRGDGHHGITSTEWDAKFGPEYEAVIGVVTFLRWVEWREWP